MRASEGEERDCAMAFEIPNALPRGGLRTRRSQKAAHYRDLNQPRGRTRACCRDRADVDGDHQAAMEARMIGLALTDRLVSGTSRGWSKEGD